MYTPHSSVTPDKTLLNKIAEMNKKFQFDWRDGNTIPEAHDCIDEVKKLVNEHLALSLKDEEAKALGRLALKCATYQLHVERGCADAALLQLHAAHVLSDPIEHAWVLNQMAAAYQQKLNDEKGASTEEKKGWERKLRECNDSVIQAHAPHKESADESARLVAFAYCTASQGLRATGDIENARQKYQEAIKIYEKIGDTNTHQYLRALNVSSSNIVDGDQTYSDLDKRWKENRGDRVITLYEARFRVNFANYLQRMKRTTEAIEQYEMSYPVLKKLARPEFVVLVGKNLAAAYQEANRVDEAEKIRQELETFSCPKPSKTAQAFFTPSQPAPASFAGSSTAPRPGRF